MAVGQSLTDKTIYTRFAQMIGTLLYMSPEQAEVNQLDVDTRADVYALRVLLYQLHTGTTPFDGDRFREAAFDEIRRILRDEDPPKPSTRLTSLGETLTGVSARRGTDPARKVVRFDGLQELFRVGQRFGVTLSPDGRRAVVTSGGRTSPLTPELPGDVQPWDVDARHVVRTEPEAVVYATFSPDGRWFAGYSPARRRLLIWDAATGERRGNGLGLLPDDPTALPAFSMVVFSPDGTRIAVHSRFPVNQGQVTAAPLVFDVDTGALVARLEGHAEWVVEMEFSPDRRRIATASAQGPGRPGEVKLWDAATGRELLALQPSPRSRDPLSGGTPTLAFSPDGHRLMLVSSAAAGRTEFETWDATPRPEPPK